MSVKREVVEPFPLWIQIVLLCQSGALATYLVLNIFYLLDQRSKLEFDVLLNSQGNIRTYPQHCHLLEWNSYIYLLGVYLPSVVPPSVVNRTDIHNHKYKSTHLTSCNYYITDGPG